MPYVKVHYYLLQFHATICRHKINHIESPDLPFAFGIAVY